MQEQADIIRKLIIFPTALMGLLGVGTDANARDVEIPGQSCNDACQAWLGYGRPRDSTGAISAEQRPGIRTFIRHDEPMTSRSIGKVHRPKVEAVKTKRPVPVNEVPATESPKTAVAAKHNRSKSQKNLADVPLPTPRPAIANDLPATVTEAPPFAISVDAEFPHKGAEAAAIPDIYKRPTAPISVPTPELPAPPDMTKLGKDLSATALVPAPAVAPTLAANTPGVARETTTSEASNKQIDQGSTDPKQSTPPPVAASLQSPADAESRIGIGDHPNGNSKKDNLQAVPKLAESPLRVNIGQISAEPRNTDVHVVVVNILQHEIKDLNVRCSARDTQGVQIAEAVAHISIIAPSDVAFGQVLFPSEINARDNQFTCNADAAAP